MFPTGRAKFVTSPAPTASATSTKTIGMLLVACLAARAGGVEGATMTSTFIRTSSAASSRVSLNLPAREPILDGDVLTLDVPEVAQALPEGVDLSRGPRRAIEQIPNPGNCAGRLLPLGGERRSEGTSQRGQQEAAAVHARDGGARASLGQGPVGEWLPLRAGWRLAPSGRLHGPVAVLRAEGAPEAPV